MPWLCPPNEQFTRWRSDKRADCGTPTRPPTPTQTTVRAPIVQYPVNDVIRNAARAVESVYVGGWITSPRVCVLCSHDSLRPGGAFIACDRPDLSFISDLPHVSWDGLPHKADPA